MPNPALPSLNALLAFETAARHLSFTRAAVELHVTQTAVSHQVRALESELGVTLFRRMPQRLTLTADGQAWANELAVVFSRLRECNQRLRVPQEQARALVAVSVIPSFGARWLVPRLGQFLLHNPEIDVRISASERLVDFALEPVDIGIRYGQGEYPGLHCTKLLDDAFVVVAAPDVASQHRRWQPAQLSGQVLLHDDYPDAWRRWFEACTHPFPKRTRQTQLTDSSMLVEAALRGQGVALARRSLASDELRAGRLVLLFPNIKPLPSGLSYYLVSPRENLRRAPIAAFRHWVLSEVNTLVQQFTAA